jgi:hypothetical protein
VRFELLVLFLFLLSGCQHWTPPEVDYLDDLFAELKVSGSRSLGYRTVLASGVERECALEEIRRYLSRDPAALPAYPWHGGRDRERYFWAAQCGVLLGREMGMFHNLGRARKEEIIREFLDE